MSKRDKGIAAVLLLVVAALAFGAFAVGGQGPAWADDDCETPEATVTKVDLTPDPGTVTVEPTATATKPRPTPDPGTPTPGPLDEAMYLPVVYRICGQCPVR